jgi:hypothetical protein
LVNAFPSNLEIFVAAVREVGRPLSDMSVKHRGCHCELFSKDMYL